MITHAQIDRRLLRLVHACVKKIDRNPGLLDRVAGSVTRIPNPQIRSQWTSLLRLPWSELRVRLLDGSEWGSELRQNAPFGGILTNAERRRIFQES